MECFVIHKNELEGRLDPWYYRPKFREFDRKLSKLKVKKIQEIAKVICGPFGSSITVKDYVQEGIPLIRISNIEEDCLSKKDIVYISKELAGKLKPYEVKEGDLIISQRGTLGVAVKVTKDFNGSIISANFIAIKNIKEIYPDFLQIFLSSKLGQIQLIRKTSGQVQTKITTDDIKTIKVPVLPESKQKEIISKIKLAYKLKKQKETEAKQLLDSINDYVLSELGIKMPELKDQMTFVVYADDVKGKRMDAYYYQPKFEEVEEAIARGKYKLVKIRNVLEYVKKGIEVGSNAYVSEGIPFIRVADIDDYKIKYEETDKKIKLELYQQLRENYKPKKDELLFSKDGTIGFCTVVEEEKDCIVSGGILRLKVKEGINHYYIKSVLSNRLFKILFEHESIGAVIKHLTPEKFLNLKIPLPPLEIQNKIAEEVKGRIKKAEQLRKEAREIVEKTKREVEKMILGNVVENDK